MAKKGFAVALQAASAADLHVLVPVAQEPEAAPPIDPDMMALMAAEADRVAAAAPPFSPAVREQVRSLLITAAALHWQDARRCGPRAVITDDSAKVPGANRPGQ